MEEEEEPWEALDLDDSDLSSSFSLRRCSRLRHHHKQPSPPPQQQQHRSIPGPAAAIQAAMHRKDRHTLPDNRNQGNDNSNGNAELVEISTQEYIRRVEEDSGEEFCRNPWLFAIDSLRCDGVLSATSLKDIKKCLTAERVDKVVAIVKSCTPNGLGDMIVTLKDPTDTMGASVHRKVLSTGDFGRLITAGSILVLQKVVAFSSTCAACYLNITRRNVVKVISVDCEVHYFPETNLDTTQGFSRNTAIADKTAAMVSRRSGRLHEDSQLSYHLNDNIIVQHLTERENCTQASSLSSRPEMLVRSIGQGQGNSSRAARPAPETVEGAVRSLGDFDSVEKRRQARDVSSAPCAIANLGDRDAWQQNGLELESLLRGMTGKRRNPVQNPAFRNSSSPENLDELGPCTVDAALKHRSDTGINSTSRGTQLRDIQSSTDSKQNGPESTGSGGVKKQRLGLISRTSVQEWTDEQLGVLEMDD